MEWKDEQRNLGKWRVEMLNHKIKKCPEYNGTGLVTWGFGPHAARYTCTYCHGTGRVKEDAKS